MNKAINRITRDDVEAFRDQATHFNIPSNTLNAYQRIATKSAIYPGQGTPLGLIYVALKLNGEAGEFAEHVGKAMRDDKWMDDIYCGYCHSSGIDPENDGRFCSRCEGTGKSNSKELTPARKTAIIKEIGDVLWYASAACNELGISLSEAALVNLQKLCDRSDRDALRGSGDDR